MIDLLGTVAGEEALAEALARRPLLALDFDGTLAPLVADPDAAILHPRAEPMLMSLAARLPVAIVSGRALADLRKRVALPGITLVGNHGNEWSDDPSQLPRGADASGAKGQRDQSDPLARIGAICAGWLKSLAEPLGAFGDCLFVESKAISLSVHYRLCPDPDATQARLRAIFERLEPRPELIEGKFVFNLMPPGLATKFEAVARLVEHHRAGTAIFVGDDVTDERVFERAPSEWLTVRVLDDEADARSQARAAVDRVDGVLALLERIAATNL